MAEVPPGWSMPRKGDGVVWLATILTLHVWMHGLQGLCGKHVGSKGHVQERERERKKVNEIVCVCETWRE